MDQDTHNTQPVDGSSSDDQELAAVLAGVSQNLNNDFRYEETPIKTEPEPPIEPTETTDDAIVPELEQPVADKPTITTSSNNDLNSIRNDVLAELRPLIDKLDLSAEDKFNICLLMLRSTDDKSLIAPAHEAAKNISNESKRAQALLDIIKEIDYLSSPHPTN